MRCIFCKQDSTTSKSVEHIIPESLGNTKHILPRGAVCDKCNQYFGAKVEKPVLESLEFELLRFNQLLKSKKGRTPQVHIGINGMMVPVRRDMEGRTHTFILESEHFQKVSDSLALSDSGQMIIPIIDQAGGTISPKLMGQFLAKMALEALALKCIVTDGWNQEIVNHTELDPIRSFARSPKRDELWEYSKRRIYEENGFQRDLDGQTYQLVHEWDILVINPKKLGSHISAEYFFVVCLFGVEYAINLGGNSIDIYKLWLKENDNISPLYSVKNSTFTLPSVF